MTDSQAKEVEDIEELGQGVKGINLTKLHTVDWSSLCACIVLVIYSTLFLANGSCSKPHGRSAESPMCVGGQLSIQAWLAILGIEFSIVGPFLLPRLLSISLSKSITSAAISKGVTLAKLLNSQSTAPMAIQFRHGWKTVFAARAIVMLLIVAVNVLYKFSFVLVNRQGTIQVSADWIEMGSSPSVPGQFCGTLYGEWPGDRSVFNYNYRDLVSSTRNSILYTGPQWVANETSGPSTLYIGPGINITSVPQLLNGTVSRCVPAGFSKFTLSTAPAPPSWFVAIVPFANSPQLVADFGSVYIAEISNSTLSIFPRTGLDDPPQYGFDYEFIVTVEIEDCWGNFSWNNAGGYQVFEMNEPVDTFCTPRDTTDFALDFNRSYTGLYATSIINAYYAGRPSVLLDPQFGPEFNTTRTIELLLLALPPRSAPPKPQAGSIVPSNQKLKAMCGKFVKEYNDAGCYYGPSTAAFATGTLDGRGVGMTTLGMALQGIVLLLSLVTVCVLLGPSLPIVTEWSAQWIELSAGLPTREIRHDLAGTSTGRSHVNGQAKVFITSILGTRDQQRAYLRLSKQRGEIAQGIEHL